jgi:hypothetical protein
MIQAAYAERFHCPLPNNADFEKTRQEEKFKATGGRLPQT